MLIGYGQKVFNAFFDEKYLHLICVRWNYRIETVFAGTELPYWRCHKVAGYRCYGTVAVVKGDAERW